MSVKERIREFIKFKGMSERQFCLKVGVSSTYVSSMRISIKPDKLLKISKAFPELNTTWLITGDGEMLRQTNGMSPTEREALISTGSEVFKDKIIEMFKSGEIFPASIVWEQHRLIIDKSKQVEDLLKEVTELKLLLAKHGIKVQ